MRYTNTQGNADNEHIPVTNDAIRHVCAGFHQILKGEATVPLPKGQKGRPIRTPAQPRAKLPATGSQLVPAPVQVNCSSAMPWVIELRK